MNNKSSRSKYVGVLLPAADFQKLDSLSESLALSRSSIIRLAMREWLATQRLQPTKQEAIV